MEPGKELGSLQGAGLWEKYYDLRKLYSNGSGKLEVGEDAIAISGDNAITRTLFAASQQLYPNLKWELIH